MLYSANPRLAKFKLFEAGLGLGATGGGPVPVNITPPAFTSNDVLNSPKVGDVLTVTSLGTWNANPAITSYQYQWYNWFTASPIVGATSSSYTITSALLAQYIACYLTATNANGTSQPVFCRLPEFVGPVTGSTPTVRGTPAQGSLTAQTTCTVPTHQAGDYLVVAIYYVIIGGAPTAPSGWTLLLTETDGTSATAMAVFGRVAASTTDTFVSGASVGTGVYNSYAVQGAVVGKDVILGATGTATPITAPSVSPAGGSDLLISMFGAVGTPVISTPSGGITATAQQTNSTAGIVTGYETLAASGPTTARTAAVTGQSNWVGVALAVE